MLLARMQLARMQLARMLLGHIQPYLIAMLPKQNDHHIHVMVVLFQLFKNGNQAAGQCYALISGTS